MRVFKDVNLANYHTFGVSVQSAWFAEVSRLTDLLTLLRSGVHPTLVLGEGSNVLFTRDFPGLVIKNAMSGKSLMPDPTDPHRVVVEVASGENWHAFVRWTLEQNLGGLENLSLIPGTTGAAPVQNIGAYGVELADVLQELEVLELHTGKLLRLKAADCGFGYRTSRFKGEWKDQFLITRLFFALSSQQHQLHTAYGDIESHLGGIPPEQRTPQQVSEAVMAIRRSKLPDPAQLGNAGSFFKNPETDRDTRDALLKKYPDLVSFPLRENRFKVPAAWLLDKAGWKGKSIGRVACHTSQPLVIVNTGGASGLEILDFAVTVAADIREKFGFRLEPEVNIFPSGAWPEGD
ncbi:MAG: UDP-N-acetylmuramate dehydrogenase [Saprospiraceae bacterium]|nr:UDP-N-acetylmuramate dehydrogenase [Saprospiraceae bacterium]